MPSPRQWTAIVGFVGASTAAIISVINMVNVFIIEPKLKGEDEYGER